MFCAFGRFRGLGLRELRLRVMARASRFRVKGVWQHEAPICEGHCLCPKV